MALLKYFNQETIDGCSVRELHLGKCSKWDRYCDTQFLMLIAAGCIRVVRRKASTAAGVAQDVSNIDTALQCRISCRISWL